MPVYTIRFRYTISVEFLPLAYFWEEWIHYLEEKIRDQEIGVCFLFCFILFVSPLLTFWLEHYLPRGNIFKHQLLNKCHTLIFLEFISLSNSHHKFYASHIFRFFQTAKHTSIFVGLLYGQSTSFSFIPATALVHNLNFLFVCSDYSNKPETDLSAYPHQPVHKHQCSLSKTQIDPC